MGGQDCKTALFGVILLTLITLMTQLHISPKGVRATLSKHILADGYDFTLDLKKSEGVYIYDSAHERKILDFFSCFASMPLGYNHPKMIGDETFRENLFLAALANPSNSDVYTEQYANFVETFSRVGIPSYLPHAFFIAGGALAIENALKVAMDWKVQKNFEKGYREEKGFKVLHFDQAFHGRSGYTLSLTNTRPDKTKWFAKFNDWPRITNPKIHFPYSDLDFEDLLKREALAISQIKLAFSQHRDEICAIIIEPIQSEGGDNHFRKEFLSQLKSLCLENEALLIYDEVQTGVGLTGKFWAHEHFGESAQPDLLAFGKKMQICGILGGKRIDEVETNCFRVSSRINSTWGGNLVDMVRADKMLQIIEEDGLVEHVRITGEYLLERTQQIAACHPEKMTNVRGRGFMVAFDLPNGPSVNKFINLSLDQNVIFLGCGERSIRFRPGLITQKSHIDEAFAVLDTVVGQL